MKSNFSQRQEGKKYGWIEIENVPEGMKQEGTAGDGGETGKNDRIRELY